MSLRQYANAPATTLTASVDTLAVVISVAAITGLPPSFPFTLILDRGTATEEVVLVTSGSGTDLTVTRGYDGTTAFSHDAGATVEHGISAIDPREANEHVNATSGVHGVVGELAFLTPTGVVLDFAGSTAPSGWLMCDGSAVSRTTYANLFAAIGETWGPGDGVTTFNLPDVADKAAVGASGTKPLGTSGGSASVTLTEANLPAHTHDIDHDHGSFTSATADATHSHGPGSLSTDNPGGHSHSSGSLTFPRSESTGGAGQFAARGNSTAVADGNVSGSTGSSGGHTHSVTSGTTADASPTHSHSVDVPSYTGTSGSTGSGSAVDVQPPFVAFNKIIKT